MHKEISNHLISTALNPDLLLADVEKLCRDAIENNFGGVCVPPLFVSKAKELTAGSQLKVATVIGFPFGYNAIESKLAEVLLAIVDGADEVDVVINIAAVKNNDWQYLAGEINTINPIVKRKGKTLKVIIESSLFTNDEIIKCCDIYGAAGVDYVQTSTGFADKGTNIDTVLLIRSHLADAVKIDAGGSIKSFSFASQLIDAGADCVSSNWALEIVKESTALN